MQPTFNISVYLAFGMKILQALQNLPEDNGYEALLERPRLHEIQGRASPEVLHDDPQFRALDSV